MQLSPITYRWSKTGWKNEYILRDGQGSEVASVNFDTWTSMNASVRVGDKSYRLKAKNWRNRDAVITDEEGREVGTFAHYWNSSCRLKLYMETYQWKQANWWGSRWKWVDERQKDVMNFHLQGWWRQKATVNFVEKTDHKLLLMVFGLYAVHLNAMDSIGSVKGRTIVVMAPL